MSNERQRKTIPILGTDTSTSDQQVKDGSMQALHNLRYSGGSWRDIKPFKEIVSVARGLKPNRISVDYNGNVTAEHRVESDITVTATWWDVDGIESSETSGVIRAGESTVEIPVVQETLGAVRVHPESDDVYIYYAEGSISSSEDTTVRIIYQHPADDNDVYIVSREVENGAIQLLRAKIGYNSFEILGKISEHTTPKIKIRHFGNVLCIYEDQRVTYYRLIPDIGYTAVNVPIPPVIKQEATLCVGSDNVNLDPKQNTIYPFTASNIYDSTNQYREIKLYSRESESLSLPTFYKQGFWGEICYFAIFQMSDGFLVSPGALNISISEPFYHGSEGMTFKGVNQDEKFICPTFRGDGDIYITNYMPHNPDTLSSFVFPWGFSLIPCITITIPKNIDAELFSYVNIYSTRVHPIWDTKKLKNLSDQRAEYLKNKPEGDLDLFWQTHNPSTALGLFDDVKLPEQPFYLMKSIPVEEFKNGECNLRITSDLLENIEHKTIYSPVSPHQFFSKDGFEYNSRMHAFGDIHTTLFAGYGDELIGTKSEEQGLSAIRLNIESENILVTRPMAGSYKDDIIPGRILSYPDSRANALYNNSAYGGKYDLIGAISNNYAYQITSDPIGGSTQDFFIETLMNPLAHRTYIKYSAKFKNAINESLPSDANFKQSYTSSNVIRVSAPNNPFVFPLANTYAIGTRDNKILAINSGAIEMSDAKFGEFPLYVFTEEGIFALQSGSGEILYSSTIPLNYDRIINPNTLAVNYNVLYITSRGLHALYSNGTSLLSEAVNDKNNEPNIEFWEGAQLAYQPKYSEVIIFNNKKDYLGHYRYTRAYVFSLSNKTWSTRDWIPFINYDGEGAYLIGTDKLVDHSATMISLLDINEEVRTEGATHCSLVSRPIKFESMEFKRIESLIPRIEVSQKTPVHVSVWASTNLVDWFPLREASGDIDNKTMAIRRTPMSARYFRIELSANVEKDIAIDSFDVEYYFRFLHRMR